MKQFIKESGLAIGTIITVAAGGFGVYAYYLGMQTVFEPKFEEVRRQTFSNSQAYNEGMVQQLSSYYLEYQKATPEEKKAMLSVVAHQYANFPQDRLPAHLQAFVASALNPVSP